MAIDPAAGYANAIRTPGLLPNATVVVDHFHIVKLANDAVTKVRRRVIWEAEGRRGRKVDPAWANRRLLLTGRERLRPKAFAAMWNGLIDSEPSGQVLTAWIVITAIFIVAFNLLADVLYGVLDPRIRLS